MLIKFKFLYSLNNFQKVCPIQLEEKTSITIPSSFLEFINVSHKDKNSLFNLGRSQKQKMVSYRKYTTELT